MARPAVTEWHPEAVLNALEQGALDTAALLTDARLADEPDDAEAWFLLGTTRHRQGRNDEALAAFRRACAIDPRDVRPRGALGAMLAAAGDTGAGLGEFEAALRLAPDNPRLLTNTGIALEACGQDDAALARYDQALAIFPGMGDALQNRAALNLRLGRVAAASVDAERLVALFPGVAALLELRAACALARGEIHAALADFSTAVAEEPRRGEAWAGNAVALAALGRLADAHAALARGMAVDAAGVARYGAEMAAESRPDGALLDPRRIYLFAAWARHRQADWRSYDDYCRTFAALVDTSTGTAAALVDRALLFAAYQLPLDVSIRRSLAADIAAEVRRNAEREAGPFVHTRGRGARIKLGYLSADLRAHPGGQALLPVFRLHDRDRFEIHAYSLHDEPGADRDRLAALCTAFHDVSALDDATIARRIHADNIDVLIDKSGYAQYGRAEVLAMRPAPLRISYLGSPGSLGPGIVDYRISDRLASPDANRAEFSEALIRLPHGHILPDCTLEIVPPVGGRPACALPARAFVYACHNNTAKIEPTVFACWMRILAARPEAVLWLLDGPPGAAANLRAAATAAGIDATRLVFAPRVPAADYRNRLVFADLYLDTLICSAHVTATDVLMAGVPLLTLYGDSWAGRIGASLASAAGLAELVCTNADRYVEQAVRLAAAPRELATWRTRLAARQAPLFDTVARVRDYERGLLAAWARHVEGLPCADLDIDLTPA